MCFKKYMQDLPPILTSLDTVLFDESASLAVARGSSIPPSLNYQHLLGATTFESRSPSVPATQQPNGCCGFSTGHQKPESRVTVAGTNEEWKENYGGHCQEGMGKWGMVVL